MNTPTWRLAPGWAIGTIALSAISAAATLLLPRLLGDAVAAIAAVGEPASAGAESWPTALVRLASILAVLVVTGGGATLTAGAYAARVTGGLRSRVLRSVTRRDAPTDHTAGGLATHVLVDARQPSAALGIGISVATAAVTLVVALVSIALVEWWVVVALLLGLVLLVGIMRRFVADTTPLVTAYRAGQSEVAERLRDAQRGAASIQAHGTWRGEARRVAAPLKDVRAAGDSLWNLQGRLAWRAGAFAPALLLVTITVGGISLSLNRITLGELTTVIAYASLVVGALDGVEAAAGLSSVRSAHQRLGAITNDEPERVAAPATVATGPVALDLVEVTTDTIDDPINLHVPAGETLALDAPPAVRAAVAGVVTATIRPTGGHVLTAGRPLDTVAEDAHVVALAAARPPLVGDSVAGLLALGLPSPDRSDIEAAARTARIHDVITALPQGYDTPLDDLALSGGELQRLGIAQALLHGSGALVLEDATSSLDPATEYEILQALTGAGLDRTVLVTSSRLARSGGITAIAPVHKPVHEPVGSQP